MTQALHFGTGNIGRGFGGQMVDQLITSIVNSLHYDSLNDVEAVSPQGLFLLV